MVAFTYRMPVGIPGAVNRAEHATVEAQIIDDAAPPTKYGQFVKLVAGKVRPLASGDAATVVYGILCRPYPTQSSNDGLGTSTPPVTGICDVLRRGYILAKVAVGAAVKGASVYAVVTAGGTVVVGDIVISTTPAGGGAAVLVVGAFFMGPADTDGTVEIMFNI